MDLGDVEREIEAPAPLEVEAPVEAPVEEEVEVGA